MWRIGRLLLVVSLVPLGLAAWAAFAPVANPGVQDCGAPVVFVAEGRTNVRLPRSGDPAHDPTTTPVLAAQARCNERVDDRLVWAAVWAALFVGAAMLGALLGLIDDRRQLRRATRFQELLREPPPDSPGPLWDRPVVPIDELGRRLPRIEREDVESVVVWGVAATIVLPVIVGARETLTALGELSFSAVALAVLAGVTLPLVAAAALAAVSLGRVPYHQAARVSLAAGGLVPLLPAFGSSGLQAHVLSRAGLPPAESRRRAGVVALAGFAALAGLIVLVVGLVSGHGWPGEAPPRAGVLAVVVGLACAVGIGLAPMRWGRLVFPVDRSLFAALATLRREPGALPAVVAVALARPMLSGLVLAAGTAASGGGVPVLVVIAIALVASVVGALSPMVAGLFVQDSVLVLALCLAGMAPGPAMAAVLVWRTMTLWLPMAAGAFAAPAIGRDG